MPTRIRLDNPAVISRAGGKATLTTPLTAQVDDDAQPCLIVLTVCEEGDQLVLDQLSVARRPDGPQVTGSAMRSLRLGHYLDVLRRVIHYYDETDEATALADGWTAEQPPPSAFDVYAPSPRNGLPPFPAEVAEVYRLARQDPKPEVHRRPTAAVASKFGISRGYAARLVSQARNSGHLRPAKRGTAGELPQKGN